jgi:ATP-binding cassette subfamily B protein
VTAFAEHAWTTGGIAAALPWLVDGGTRALNAVAAFDGVSLDAALSAAAVALGVEITPITCPADRLADALSSLAPMVVPVPGGGALFVARATRRRAIVSAPDGRRIRLGMNDLTRALAAVPADARTDPIDALTSKLGRRAQRVGDALRRQRASARPLFLGWTFERSRSDSTPAGFGPRQWAPLVVTHVLQFSLWIASWVVLVALLSGVGDRTQTTVVWIGLLATSLALLPVESSLEQSFAARVGIAVKQRLFTDALDADKRQVGALGLGRMIAQSLETHHLDSLAARGGVRVVLAALDLLLVFLAYALAIGIDGLLVLFAFILALLAYYARDYYEQARRFLADNIDVTSVHTEQLVGHRTRKAFVAAERWNVEEDRSLARYHEAGRRFDAAQLRIARIPRTWTLLALFVVITTLYRGYGGDAGAATVAMIGFVIITSAALQSIVTGGSEAIRAWLSFEQLDAFDPDPTLHRDRGLGVRPDADGEFLCRGVSYTYPGALQPVLADVDLAIAPRERLLMTGRSGSGKSTMAAVMSGRTPQDSGVVLSGGVDRHIVGLRQWRRLVCYVPQAAANHVLTETFAFNLLLGRAWPPNPRDLADAEEVARALGLDDLLERMPAGMMQMVGEGGWTLSQGEKARLFIARGLLQRARLLIADEVLSPLDAGNALKTLDALERHDGRLMLIAHS